MLEFNTIKKEKAFKILDAYYTDKFCNVNFVDFEFNITERKADDCAREYRGKIKGTNKLFEYLQENFDYKEEHTKWICEYENEILTIKINSSREIEYENGLIDFENVLICDLCIEIIAF